MVKTYTATISTTHKLLLAALLWLFTQAAIATVNAHVDRNTLRLGETVTLVLEAADTAQTLEINRDLLTADFILIDTRSESTVKYVNGRQTSSVRVLYVLEPRKTGELTIPAFSLGSVTTKAINLTVNPAPAEIDGEPPMVFVEVGLSEGQSYVHSQLVLTVKLYYRYNLSEANLADPQIDHAAVIKLGEKPMNANRHGVNYRALERVYAVFPERSGELTIPQLEFWGRVNDPATRRSGSLFSPLNRGRRVRASSEALRIIVAPKPAQYPETASWLPAQELSLNSELKTSGHEIRVGEPLTRVVQMRATGLLDTMLPDINWPALEGARVYPDTPETIARSANNWVTSLKTSGFAIVPEREGELLLPEISIPWWDVKADKLKYAIVPAERVQVLPARDGVVAAAPPPVTTVIPPVVNNPVNEVSAAAVNSGEVGFWRTLAVAGFSLWLLTIVLFLVMRRNRQHKPKRESLEVSHGDAFAELERACKQGKEKLAVTALRKFSQNELGIADGLSGLAQYCAEDGYTTLAASINAMNRDLYSSQLEAQSLWDGRNFVQQLKGWLKERAKNSSQQRDQNSLPPFYPE